MDAAQVSTDGIASITPRRLEAARSLGALLFVALLVRAIPWLANLPLHHDEALYGTWARAIADGSDPLLLIPWVDKPPLVLYLLASSIKLFGASEIALRVPGMIAGLLTVWATFGLARRAGGERAAWAAAVLVALSPFAILFAPTAFTDGWLTLCLVAAAWAALAGRAGWAGVLLGLACASKQQGVMGIPLVLALVVVGSLDQGRLDHENAKANEGREARSPRRALAAVGLAALGFAVVFGAVTYWDSVRWHNRPSYWDQSLQTYGGVVLAPLAEWPQRAGEWAAQAGYWFGVWPVTTLVLLLAAVGELVGQHRPQRARVGDADDSPTACMTADACPSSRACIVIIVYVLGYLLVHLAFTFQPWDRYLLPVLPLACVLCGKGLVSAWDWLKASRFGSTGRWAGVGLTAGLLYAASLGVTASIPVGSDIGAYHGVAEAAAFLRSQPPGTRVYYDRIGWHLGYYLYGRPVTRSWYDSPQKLAREAARVAGEDAGAVQWLALPAWEQAGLPALRDALAAKGFVALPAYTATGKGGSLELTLYRLELGAMAAGQGRSGLNRMQVGP